MTVAMLAAGGDSLEGISKHWKHSPTLRDKEGRTVAMIAACYPSI